MRTWWVEESDEGGAWWIMCRVEGEYGDFHVATMTGWPSQDAAQFIVDACNSKEEWDELERERQALRAKEVELNLMNAEEA